MARLAAVLVLVAALAGAAPPTIADRIVVNKAKRELLLLQGDRVLRSYKVALGRNPVGHKQRQGDGRTPEGDYYISARYKNSQFHWALYISYPNAEDRARARRAGVDPGGDILIHGLPNGQGWIGAAHRAMDWTEGCIAVTDEEIEEIFRLTPARVPVRINP